MHGAAAPGTSRISESFPFAAGECPRLSQDEDGVNFTSRLPHPLCQDTDPVSVPVLHFHYFSDRVVNHEVGHAVLGRLALVDKNDMAPAEIVYEPRRRINVK